MENSVFVQEDLDTLKLLTEDFIAPPDLAAPIYQNLDSFINALKKQKEDEKNIASGEPLQKKVSVPLVAPVERKFLPEQGPESRGRCRPPKNIFTWMASIDKGPMKLLRESMDKQLKVKAIILQVWTRSAVSIRGFCLGYVSAFDKHWNLALTDVDEIFFRQKRRKTPAFGDVDSIPLVELRVAPTRKGARSDHIETVQQLASTEEIYSSRRAEKQPKNPSTNLFAEVRVIENTKGGEICERHVNQLLLRGENIVMVSVVAGNAVTGVD